MQPWYRRVGLCGVISLTLAWDPVADIEGYRMYLKSPVQEWSQAIQYDAKTATTITLPIEEDATTLFAVRAYRGTEESANSNVVSYTPMTCPAELATCETARAALGQTLQTLRQDVPTLKNVVTGIQTLGKRHALRKALPTLQHHIDTLEAAPSP